MRFIFGRNWNEKKQQQTITRTVIGIVQICRKRAQIANAQNAFSRRSNRMEKCEMRAVAI